MKSTIFFFLVCCSFQIVVAGVTHQDFIKLHDEGVKNIYDIRKPIEAAVQTAVDAANKKGINIDGCMESTSMELQTYLDSRIVELDNCRDASFKNLNKETAQKCFSDIIDGFKKGANEALKFGLGCVEKCVHTDCSEN